MISIRKATQFDLPAISEIVTKYFVDEIHEGVEILEEHADASKFISFYKDRMRNKVPFVIYIASKDDEIIGIAGGNAGLHHWSYTSKWGREDFWFVKKEHRGGKAGLMLFEKLMEWFESVGVHRIHMTHYTWNPKIEHFYRKKGFIPYEINYVYKVKEN
jgi:RimJ/RimL family protein N-acetyltransferase|tara:strand:+ start:289 stop:765 length:477 start_codon:yes stop_codon:yes gene_type:complete